MHSKTSRVSERLIYLQQNDKKSTNIQLDIIWKRIVRESEQSTRTNSLQKWTV